MSFQNSTGLDIKQDRMSYTFNKKAQLSLTNTRDVKVCQKLLQFDVLTTLSLTYWPIFIRLAAVASEICEIPINSLKIQTYEVQGHPRSSILVPIESPYVTCYYSLIVTLAVSATVFEIFTVKDRKLLILLTPPVFNAPLAAERHEIST